MSEKKFNTPWEIGPGSTTIITSEGFHLITNVDGMGTVTQDYETAAHIVHCVNTYEEREALLKEMAEALKFFSLLNPAYYNDLVGGIIKTNTVLEKYKSHTS